MNNRGRCYALGCPNLYSGSMAGPKRSLAPRFDPNSGRCAKSRTLPLREGFAIPRDRPAPLRASAGEQAIGGGNPKPYGRGSAADALAHMADPSKCMDSLKKDICAATTVGPTASRRKLWAELATKAGASDPFELEPSLIFKVMGALKLAGFRSSIVFGCS